MKKSILLIILLIAAIKCSSIVEPQENEIRFLTSAEKEIANSSSSFGLKIFKKIIQAEGEKNIFISPLSISMALGMTMNGADGETYNAMRSTLEFDGISQQQINESYQSLIELLTGVDSKVVFKVANSIWYRQELNFEKEFIDLNKKYFDAVISPLDFNNDNSVDIINNWVNQNTDGLITEIIKTIPAEAIMYLINAVYFKGTWQFEFEKEKTIDDYFTSSNDRQLPCKLMVQENDYSFYANEQFQMIDLPYGEGAYSMTIILPKNNIEAIVSILNEQNWNSWIDNLSEQTGTLLLPKFKLEYKLLLNDVLKAMGMSIAFDPGNADFTKLYNGIGNAFISKVEHKTFIELNEEGTEAAAVTSVEISFDSAGGGFVMRVDKPFIFAIREMNSNSILFIGQIFEPQL